MRIIGALLKAQYPANLVVETTATFDDLQHKQKLFFDLVMNHCRLILDWGSPNQLLHLDGQGGTGKTHVIMYLCQELDRLTKRHQPADAPSIIVQAAPSGVAVFGISGNTVHSLFHVSPRMKEYEPFSTQAHTALQASFRGVKCLLIGGKLMTGLQQFAWINRRCQEIWAERADTPFGGLNVIPCGDFFQLPPVAAKVQYH
jgi:PIF1-like helicase